MFFRKLLDTAAKHKRLLGAASVAGFGFGTASMTSMADMKTYRRNLVSANYHKLMGGLLHNSSIASPMAECAEKQWPIYRRTEVQKEARENNKVWITYGNGVYDLT